MWREIFIVILFFTFICVLSEFLLEGGGLITYLWELFFGGSIGGGGGGRDTERDRDDDQDITPPTPVPDEDGDGLSDHTELWVAQTFAPVYIFDEEEPMENVGYVYQVSPVIQNNIPGVLFTLVALYQKDYAEIMDEFMHIIHYGDTERLAIFISVSNGDYVFGNYVFENVEINCHGGKKFYWRDELSFDGTHFLAYPSQGKHCVFIDPNCGGSKDYFFYDEDCAGQTPFIPHLPEELNVGEVNHKNFTKTDQRSQLASLFPGETIWGDERFCGGYDVPFPDDLVYDLDIPYVPDLADFLEIMGKPRMCAGSIGGKWFRP